MAESASRTLPEDSVTLRITLTWADGTTEEQEPMTFEDRAAANRFMAGIMLDWPDAEFIFERLKVKQDLQANVKPN